MYIEDPVEAYIKSNEELVAEIPWHPKIPEMGSRKYVVGPNDVIYIEKEDLRKVMKKQGEVRLMELGNFKIVDSISKILALC